jgi:SNF family Na+-dependent transporter
MPPENTGNDTGNHADQSVSGDAPREAWGSRIGLILAAAGNAIGIGNLLRFPGQAAKNGGGAFMIPYVVSLVLFGLPMMWVAWTIGRIGGRHGHGTTPGMFDRLWKSPAAKYLGVLGVAIPFIFCIYYTYIESWCLAYSYFSLTGDYAAPSVDLQTYLQEYQGDAPTHNYFSGLSAAFVFLLISLALNVVVLFRGIARGIELLAKIAVPLLVLFCVVLVVRIFTTEGQQGTALSGLAYLFTPDLSKLQEPGVWMSAAGQVFFTLSIGFGSLECFASYLRDKDDVALTGLTTASTNEFVEVVFGSLITIPAAALFYGGSAANIEEIASRGTFNLGMISMPEVLRNMPGESVQVFGTIWFFLLFLAAFTSSVAVCQPVMAFFQDENRMQRGSAAIFVGLIWLLGTLPVMYFLKYGVLDEMDFWAGTIGLVVFSTIEVIIFAWIFGMKRGWDELHLGADIRVPQVFFYITKYLTPICLLLVCGWWFYDAIKEDKLIPAPKVSYGVVNIANYEGKFDRKAAVGGTDELVTVNSALAEIIERAEDDVNAWAEVAVGADGSIRLESFSVSPGTVSDAGHQETLRASFQKLLELDGFRYRVPDANGDLTNAPATVTLAFEGLYTFPYIWLTRVIIICFTLFFLVNVRVIWKNRERESALAARRETT